jgi:hypothetical protein
MKLSSKRHARLIEAAKSLPSYCVYAEDYHHSDEWGKRLIAGWINLKRTQVVCGWSAERFREALIDLVIELDGGWDDAFAQAAQEEGIDFDCMSHEMRSQMFDAYRAANQARAFDLIPGNLHAEFCWVPGWDGVSLDSLMEEFGQRSERYNSNYLDDVRPGRWLSELLSLGNCSSEALRAHCMSLGEPGRRFVEATADLRWKVQADASRPAILSPEDVVNIIENGHTWAVPMFHCEINVRALFEFDCTQAMVLTSDKRGEVHLGLHDGVLNGTGYMDTYPGAVVIPAEATGFAGAARWRWSINETYGIVRSVFRSTPERLDSALKAAA